MINCTWNATKSFAAAAPPLTPTTLPRQSYTTAPYISLLEAFDHCSWTFCRDRMEKLTPPIFETWLRPCRLRRIFCIATAYRRDAPILYRTRTDKSEGDMLLETQVRRERNSGHLGTGVTCCNCQNFWIRGFYKLRTANCCRCCWTTRAFIKRTPG